MQRDNIKELYQSGEYIEKNPDLHEEDSPWKISKLLPFVDQLMSGYEKDKVVILDVGGGAGVILKEVSEYIFQKYKKSVRKYCLDLSPGMLAVQKKNNPDAVKFLQKDISDTGLEDDEIDLALMIDVLEHVPEPEKVLEEISRISRFALFKVPLEDSFYYRAMGLLTGGKHRERIVEKIGHVNVFSRKSLEKLLEKYCGEILDSEFTNVYKYLLTTRQNFVDWVFNVFGYLVFLVSPGLSAKLFSDYLIVLVKCE